MGAALKIYTKKKNYLSIRIFWLRQIFIIDNSTANKLSFCPNNLGKVANGTGSTLIRETWCVFNGPILYLVIPTLDLPFQFIVVGSVFGAPWIGEILWHSSEIIVQTRLLAISQDCRQSCEIVKSCENRAVGVQISDFCLWWRHYSRRPNTSRKIVPRLFIERLFLYHCEIVARLLKKFHVWYGSEQKTYCTHCTYCGNLLRSCKICKIHICSRCSRFFQQHCHLSYSIAVKYSIIYLCKWLSLVTKYNIYFSIN